MKIKNLGFNFLCRVRSILSIIFPCSSSTMLVIVMLVVLLFPMPILGGNSRSIISELEHKYSSMFLPASVDEWSEKCGMESQNGTNQLSTIDRWINAFNSNTKELTGIYLDSSFVLTSEGDVYQGADAIVEYYRALSDGIGSIVSTQLLYERELNSSTIKYQIHSFVTHDGVTYIQLVILEKNDGVFHVRFGAMERKQNDLPDITFLKQLRADWAEAASSHNARNFVNKFYTHDCVYFWHSNTSLHIGRDELAGAYSFMDNPNYRIVSLTPYYCEAVSPSLVFEIGRWDMPQWNGDYVIIWRKDSDGVWRILFDSNY